MNEDNILEKIVALSDGELSSSESAEVYQLIAANPELQVELNHHLKMKNVYKRIETPPPIHLKSNILEASGLAYVFWKTKGFIFSMLTSGLAVVAFLGYQLDVFGFKDNSENLKLENHTISDVKVDEKIILPKLNKEYSNIESFSTNFKNNKNQNSKRNVLNILSSNLLDDEVQSSIQNQENNEIVKLENSNNLSVFNAVILHNSKSGEGIILNRLNTQNSEAVDEFISKLNLNFRKSITNQMINLDLSNTQQLDLNNASISLMYEYSENFHFGFEVNGEEFAQKFSTMVNDSVANYQQFYNSYYFGIAGKYFLPFKTINDRLSFFGKGMLGATSIGPVVRVEIGGEFHIYDKWSVVTSYELSNLIYSVNGKLNVSNRNGANFGFKYDF